MIALVIAPPLTVSDGELVLHPPEWDRRSAEGAVIARSNVLLSVGGDAMIFDDALITDATRDAYARVLRGGDAMRERLLDALATSDGAVRARVVRAEIRAQVLLQNITIFRVVRGEVAYVGYGFACDWDPEHGAGVMTHGDRVVAVGGADTAVLSWIAKRDGGVEEPARSAAKKGTKKRRAR